MIYKKGFKLRATQGIAIHEHMFMYFDNEYSPIYKYIYLGQYYSYFLYAYIQVMHGALVMVVCQNWYI